MGPPGLRHPCQSAFPEPDGVHGEGTAGSRMGRPERVRPCARIGQGGCPAGVPSSHAAHEVVEHFTASSDPRNKLVGLPVACEGSPASGEIRHFHVDASPIPSRQDPHGLPLRAPVTGEDAVAHERLAPEARPPPARPPQLAPITEKVVEEPEMNQHRLEQCLPVCPKVSTSSRLHIGPAQLEPLALLDEHPYFVLEMHAREEVELRGAWTPGREHSYSSNAESLELQLGTVEDHVRVRVGHDPSFRWPTKRAISAHQRTCQW